MSDKGGWKDRAQQFWDSRWRSRDPGLSTSPAKEHNYALGITRWVYSVGLLGAKTEIPAYILYLPRLFLCSFAA